MERKEKKLLTTTTTNKLGMVKAVRLKGNVYTRRPDGVGVECHQNSEERCTVASSLFREQ